MPPQDILTPRLALIPITPEALRSEQANDGQLATILNAQIPKNWPPADWEPHVFAILLAQYEKHPEQIAWHRYITLLNPDHTRILIGCAGAFWRDTSPTECEIGYSILPPWEGRGLATEAARALIAQIRLDPRIESIIAHTFPHLAASIRIMEKCGLTLDGEGEEPGTIRYRLRRSIIAAKVGAHTAAPAASKHMPIARLIVELEIPHAQSLKDRRQVVRSLKDKLRHAFNAGVAELDEALVWNRATLGIVAISSSTAYLRGQIEEIERALNRLTIPLGAAILDTDTEIFDE